MISNVDYNTPLTPSYFRNNRSTRQKSMRCFPSCSVKGHISGGKCGVPLCVTIKMTDLNCNFDEFLFIAELRPSQEPRLSSSTRIGKSLLMDQLRSKHEKSGTSGELFLAEIGDVVRRENGVVDCVLVFNSQHCSWDYSWKSNRWSGPIQDHVIDIIALRSVSAQEYLICSSKPSAPFIIVSSHKKSTKTAPVVAKTKRDRERPKSRARDGNVDDATSILSQMVGDAVSSSGRVSRKKAATAPAPYSFEEEGEDFDQMAGRYDSSSSSSGDQLFHSVPPTSHVSISTAAAVVVRTSGSRKRSHSTSAGEVESVAHALMSLVRPASYFFDIKKSMEQQHEQQQHQQLEEERQREVRRQQRNLFQYGSDSSESGQSGDEGGLCAALARECILFVLRTCWEEERLIHCSPRNHRQRAGRKQLVVDQQEI